MGALSQWELSVSKLRQAEGIKKAKLKGVYLGRKRSIDAGKIKAMAAEGLGATVIAQRMGCSRQSVYRSLT